MFIEALIPFLYFPAASVFGRGVLCAFHGGKKTPGIFLDYGRHAITFSPEGPAPAISDAANAQEASYLQKKFQD